MGAVLEGCYQHKNRYSGPVNAEPTYEREAPSVNALGRVHVIIFALDYAGTEYASTSNVRDARAMADLARTHCGVTSIIEHHERMCTPSTFRHCFGQVSSKMRNDDYLVFYFAGHGKELSTDDEAEPREEGETPMALTLYNKDGTLVDYSCNEFAELVANSVNPKARVLMLFDCCQPTSMMDLTNPMWDELEAISLNGVEDKSENDPKVGGIFTQSVLYAVQKLQQENEPHYSVGATFNKMLKEGQRVCGRGQHFWLEHSSATTPSSMAWPLLPTTKYSPAVKRRPSKLEARRARGGA